MSQHASRLGCHLPGMSHIADTAGRHIQIQRWSCISYIAHICRSGLILMHTRHIWMYLIIQRPLQNLCQLVTTVSLHNILFNSLQSHRIVRIQKLLRQFIIRSLPFRSPNLHHTLRSDLTQRIIWYIIRECHGDLIFHSGSSHESCTSCHINHSFKQFLHLGNLRRTNLIFHQRVILHYIRRRSACIHISIVDPCFIDHMLSQIIHSHAHQFRCIQSTSS